MNMLTKMLSSTLSLNAFMASLLVSSILLLSACGGNESPDPNLTSTSPSTEQEASTKGSLVFDPIASNVPFPNDILFAGSTDGTLNLTVAADASSSDPTIALNELDGFSTTAPLSVGLSKRFESTNLNAAVKMFQVTTDATTKAVTGLSSTLTAGVDFMASLSSDAKSLVIVPLKPLQPKSSYMVVVTNAATDINGKNAVVGRTYALLKQTTALVDGNGNSITAGVPTSLAGQLETIRQLTQAQLAVAVGAGLTRDDIVMSWSFSTQSTADVLQTVTTGITNTSLAVANTGTTTTTFGGDGSALVYAGSIDVPYYLTAVAKGTTDANNAALTSKWRGTNGILTRFSVALGDKPVATSTVKIPVLMTVPTTGSNWKVVIFQHGITADRSNLLAIADTLAKAGYVGIAIDMPLHGITPTNSAAALRNASLTERTFDMDLDNNGVVDDSGAQFINLTSLLTTRDNLRQAVSDLAQLKASLGSLTGAVDVDETDVSFVGHSLGGIVGGMFVNQTTDIKAAVYAMSGVQVAYLLTASPTFAPRIEAGLAAQGVQKGSADFTQFVRVAQTVVDSADPVNYVAANTVPSLLIEVVGDGNSGTSDQVIPNSVSTAPLAGTEPWVTLQGLNTLTNTGAVTAGKGVLRFTAGDHSSLLLPTASAGATVAMQEAMASFISTMGTAISVTSNATIKQ